MVGQDEQPVMTVFIYDQSSINDIFHVFYFKNNVLKVRKMLLILCLFGSMNSVITCCLATKESNNGCHKL